MNGFGAHMWRAGLRMHPPVDIIGGRANMKPREKAFRPNTEPKKREAEREADHSPPPPPPPPPPAWQDGMDNADGNGSLGAWGNGRTRPGFGQLHDKDQLKRIDRRRHWDKKTWRPLSLGPPPADHFIPATPRPREDHGLYNMKRLRKAGTEEVVERTRERNKNLIFDTPSRRLACRTDDTLTVQIERLLLEAYRNPDAIEGTDPIQYYGKAAGTLATRSSSPSSKLTSTGHPPKPGNGSSLPQRARATPAAIAAAPSQAVASPSSALTPTTPPSCGTKAPDALAVAVVPSASSGASSGDREPQSGQVGAGRQQRPAIAASGSGGKRGSGTEGASPASGGDGKSQGVNRGAGRKAASRSPASQRSGAKQPLRRAAGGRREGGEHGTSPARSVNLLFSEEAAGAEGVEEADEEVEASTTTSWSEEDAAAAAAAAMAAAAEAEDAYETLRSPAARGGDPSGEKVRAALETLIRLCEVDTPSSDTGSVTGSESEWDESAPPCIVRQSGTIVSYEELITAVLSALKFHAGVPSVQAPGCSLISHLANCEAAKQQSTDAGAFEVIAGALKAHAASKHVQQCAALAVLKLTLPSQPRPDSRDAMRVQIAIGAGILDALEAIANEHSTSSSQEQLQQGPTPYEAIKSLEDDASSGPTGNAVVASKAAHQAQRSTGLRSTQPSQASAPPPLRVRLSAAAAAWLGYVQHNFLAATPAREPGSYADNLDVYHGRAPSKPPGPAAINLHIGHVGRGGGGTPPSEDGSISHEEHRMGVGHGLGWQGMMERSAGGGTGAAGKLPSTSKARSLWDEVLHGMRTFRCFGW